MWLRTERVFFVISRLGFGIPSLGLGLSSFGFGDHILDYESILGGIGFGWWLDSFTLILILRPRTPHNILLILSSPCWDFSIQRRGLDGGGLLKRRKRKSSGRREHNWIFSDIFWEEDILNTPQFRSGRNSYPVERFSPYLGAVVPAHPSCHLSQPCLRVQHPTFIGCYLLSLSSVLGHSSCFFNFLQLSLEIQYQLSLGGQVYLS